MVGVVPSPLALKCLQEFIMTVLPRVIVQAFAHPPTTDHSSSMVLVTQPATLPSITLLSGEHPAEGAWRLLQQATSNADAFTTFRSLPKQKQQGERDDSILYFETSADIWPPPTPSPGFSWIRVEEVNQNILITY